MRLVSGTEYEKHGISLLLWQLSECDIKASFGGQNACTQDLGMAAYYYLGKRSVWRGIVLGRSKEVGRAGLKVMENKRPQKVWSIAWLNK